MELEKEEETAKPIDRYSNPAEGICFLVSIPIATLCSLPPSHHLDTIGSCLSWSSVVLLELQCLRDDQSTAPQGRPRRPCGSFRRVGRRNDPQGTGRRCSRLEAWLCPSSVVQTSLQSCRMPCVSGGTMSTPLRTLRRWRASGHMVDRQIRRTRGLGRRGGRRDGGSLRVVLRHHST